MADKDLIAAQFDVLLRRVNRANQAVNAAHQRFEQGDYAAAYTQLGTAIGLLGSANENGHAAFNGMLALEEEAELAAVAQLDR